MNLTIKLPDEDVAALKARATAQGISEEQYALQVLEQDLVPNCSQIVGKRQGSRIGPAFR